MPRASKGGFYAVGKGRKTGVFSTWEECESQIRGFPGARYKKFTNAADAEVFVATSPTKTASNTTSIQVDVPILDISPKQVVGHTQSLSETARDVVYCDGACKGNGQVGSVAGVGVWWGREDPRNFAERCPGDQTNNRAELIAIVRILETTPIKQKPLLIRTDSQYSIKSFKEWLPRWRRNGFRTASGQPVKNAPLIRYLSSLLDQRASREQKVTLEYVKGHSGDEGNDGADALANQGCMLVSIKERNWAAEEKQIRANFDHEPGIWNQDNEMLEDTVAVQMTLVNPEDIDFEFYADALLSDSELRELAAKGFESDN